MLKSIKSYFTIYLRPKKDKDIVDYLKQIDEGDRSREIRELIRKGINSSVQNDITYSHRNITESNRTDFSSVIDFDDIEIKKSEVSDDELEDRL